MACCNESNRAPNGHPADSPGMAVVFSALSNPARIDILRHISLHRNCGCKEITEVLPLAQSTVSQHLKVLIEAGIVVVETVPPRSQYHVNEVLLKSMADATSSFLDSCCGKKCC